MNARDKMHKERKPRNESEEESNRMNQPQCEADEDELKDEGTKVDEEGAEAKEGQQYEPVAVLPLRDLNVVRMVNFVIGLLIEHAWQKMGLLANPITGRVEQDIEEARLAIDTLAILIEHIKPKLREKEYDQLRQTLTTLRINFVEQTSKRSEA